VKSTTAKDANADHVKAKNLRPIVTESSVSGTLSESTMYTPQASIPVITEADAMATVATQVDSKAQSLQRGLSFHIGRDRHARMAAEQEPPNAYAMTMRARKAAVASKRLDLCRKHLLVAAPLASCLVLQ
jgi:hypothetical protein